MLLDADLNALLIALWHYTCALGIDSEFAGLCTARCVEKFMRPHMITYADNRNDFHAEFFALFALHELGHRIEVKISGFQQKKISH